MFSCVRVGRRAFRSGAVMNITSGNASRLWVGDGDRDGVLDRGESVGRRSFLQSYW